MSPLPPPSPVRVCLFTDSLEPSGVGEHMLTLAGELMAGGSAGRFRLSFVCPPGPGGDPFLARAGAMGVEAAGLAVNRPDLRDGFCRWLRARAVSVFHGHAGIGWEGHDGIHAARQADTPVVLRTEHLPYLLTDPWQQSEHTRIIEAVDCLLAVSHGARSTFDDAGLPAHKLRAVQNGIRLRPAPGGAPDLRRALGLAATARIVLTVGRYTDQKGHCYLADAVPAVRAAVPDAHFVWVGDGPLEDDLRGQVAALGMGGCVHFLGKRGDVSGLLADADLFVLPSLFEGLPAVILEAMAAGRPVVATAVCGSSETVRDGETGRLVPPRSPAALADAITDALAQPARAAAWGAAGRRLFERQFTAARMARETASLYEELLSRASKKKRR